MSNWEISPGSVATWGLGGMALGAGARLAKYLADVNRDRDVSSAVSVQKNVTPVSEIPVKVTPEEAEELRRKGIKVKTALSKLAWGVPEFAAGAGLGALGAGAAYGGWKLVDYAFDKQRKSEAKARLEKARRRVESLLNDKPEVQDVKLAAFMHGAESQYMKKTAILGLAVDAVATGLSPVAPLIGAIGLIGGAAAYNRARSSNKATQKAKLLRRLYVDDRKEEAPVVTMVPVVDSGSRAGSPAEQARA